MIKIFFGFVGRRAFGALSQAHSAYQLSRQSLYWTVIAPVVGRGLRWRSSVEQMVLVGVNSIPIVSFITVLVGIIMAMQSAYQLKRFGATIYVADLVGVSMTRELAPLLTAIIIAGRSGSAIAAEIGTMRVSEEVEALEVMGLNPVKFLVVPKLIAMIVMLPCLTVIADVVGIAGGFIIAAGVLGINPERYLGRTMEALVLKDLATGLIKSVAFAIIIVMVGCRQGFNVKGGAEEVGQATTSSVVNAIFLIILADCAFTALFYFRF